MRHRSAADRLSEYLDGTLAPRRARAVEMHLLRCATCRGELGELQRVRSMLRELRGVDDAPDLAGVVLARIEAGEADGSALERLRWNLGRLFARPWSAPLATLAAGLLILAFLPPIEIEVRIPGAMATEAGRPVAQAPRPAPVAPLASRRVAESVLPPSLDLPQRMPEASLGLQRLPAASLGLQRLPAASFDCWERPSFDACQEQRHVLMDLLQRDTSEFFARLDTVPGAARERWIRELSRFAAETGSARSLAERLRASDDPRAWQVASRFEAADFSGR